MASEVAAIAARKTEEISRMSKRSSKKVRSNLIQESIDRMTATQVKCFSARKIETANVSKARGIMSKAR